MEEEPYKQKHMGLILTKKDNHSYEIRSSFNNKYLGDAVIDIDGYYYYWPSEKLSGSWSSHNLKEIANILDDLNREYEEEIKNNHINT